jgi:hypothetical protein
MKLRIHGNSVRFRLTQGEVLKLAEGHAIEQVTEFSASSRLVTHIESSRDVDRSTAAFENNRLTLRLPIDLVRQWAKTDQVGIEVDQPIDDSRSLYVLVEKDFDCLHSQAEENIDTFPNPNAPGNCDV